MQSLPTLGPGAAGSSPKFVYVSNFFLLYNKYFDTLRTASEDTGNIDAATAALIAFCPDKPTRESLWNTYINKKKSDEDILTAAVFTIGDLISYLSDTLEFTEKATGGF